MDSLTGLLICQSNRCIIGGRGSCKSSESSGRLCVSRLYRSGREEIAHSSSTIHSRSDCCPLSITRISGTSGSRRRIDANCSVVAFWRHEWRCVLSTITIGRRIDLIVSIVQIVHLRQLPRSHFRFFDVRLLFRL